uniref:Uncharacterized protein n=1 Tax=Anguilla anguilla TaxID=7936 RepID=A0A0E9T120_ANGAN
MGKGREGDHCPGQHMDTQITFGQATSHSTFLVVIQLLVW